MTMGDKWPFLGVGVQGDWTFDSDMWVTDCELVVANVNSSATLTGAAATAFEAAIPDDRAYVVMLNISFYGEGEGPFVSIKGGPRTQVPIDGVGASPPVVVQAGSGSGFVIDSTTGAINEDYRISGIGISPTQYGA